MLLKYKREKESWFYLYFLISWRPFKPCYDGYRDGMLLSCTISQATEPGGIWNMGIVHNELTTSKPAQVYCNLFVA